MNRKVIGTAMTSIILLSTLAACGGASNGGSDAGKTKNSYATTYATDIDMLDYLVTMRQTNSMHYSNFVDGLFETDSYGNLKPALAESVKLNSDETEYTYQIRKGVKWVDNNGNEVAEVKPSDWVTALKHAVDKKSEILYIVQDSIKGLDDYVAGKTKDFNTVGIKADDKAMTLTYTLNAPEPYWNSKTLYSILYPINEDFLKSKGDKFGGTTPDSILYNGPFLLTNNTAKSEIDYKKNENYWDKKNVHIDTVKKTYNDGSDPSFTLNGFEKGSLDAATLYPNDASYKQAEAKYKDNIIQNEPGGTTYNIVFNFNRRAFAYTSKKDDKAKQDTHEAIMNKDFRRAITFSVDKVSYIAQIAGEDAAKKHTRNTLVPGTFVTAPDGKSFGDLTKAENASDPEFGTMSLADGSTDTFNKDAAKKSMDAAKKALEAKGVKFPIHLDLIQASERTAQVNQAKSLKQSIESTLGKDNVVVDIQLQNQDKYLAVTYLATSGAAVDYDISNASGWGPDYQDPKSYLNIYSPTKGDMLTSLGLEPGDKDAEVKEQLGFNEYQELLDAADKERTDLNKRYALYAKAEAWLDQNAIQVPLNDDNYAIGLTKIEPFSQQYGWAGIHDSYNLKFAKIQTEPVTTAEYNKAQKTWKADKEKTAKKDYVTEK